MMIFRHSHYFALFRFLGAKAVSGVEKSKNAKSAKDEKASFSLRAPNSEKHKHLGTFLEPKTPKIAFSTFGPTFPFWSVSGAKSAPEAKNQHISGFSSQKWKNSVFAILVEKGCPKRYVYKGFYACGETM